MTLFRFYRKEKISAEFIYPFKRTKLEESLEVFPENTFFSLSYNGMQRREAGPFVVISYKGAANHHAHVAGRISISVYAVQKSKFLLQNENFKEEALIRIRNWVSIAVNEKQTWRDWSHSLRLFITDNGLGEESE